MTVKRQLANCSCELMLLLARAGAKASEYTQVENASHEVLEFFSAWINKQNNGLEAKICRIITPYLVLYPFTCCTCHHKEHSLLITSCCTTLQLSYVWVVVLFKCTFYNMYFHSLHKVLMPCII